MRTEATRGRHDKTRVPPRARRGLAAFECGCFGDWSDEPPVEREQHARTAVDALVSSILAGNGGAS